MGPKLVTIHRKKKTTKNTRYKYRHAYVQTLRKVQDKYISHLPSKEAAAALPCL